jgi:cell division protein FtsZ
MANAKRASMREGPLAALFRKTEEDGEGLTTPPDGVAATLPGTEPEAVPGAAEPQTAAPAAGPAPPARERPHPSLSAQTPAGALAEEERQLPTPQDRLRQAFSSEIPADVLEPPGGSASRAPQRHVPSVHDEPDGFSAARPVGSPSIRVVGVGGAGVNAVNRMVEAEVHGIEFIAVNTDLQSLQQSTADITLHIGSELTRGLGAGSDPDVGRASAMEEYDKIKALLKGSDMIFIAAGAGGGTGTGAAPVVARIAREVGALTVGIVTKPFGFEGTRRSTQADRGVQALADEVDTLIVVPNNRLLTVLEKGTSMIEAFRVADDVLRQGVQGISDLVTLPGLINLDFADVRTIMSDAGNALLGIGMGVGDKRALDAAEQAVSSPLLETSMEGARSILLSITGGNDLSLFEVSDAAKAVAEAAHPDANIIFGAMVDEKLEDQVWVTVVATSYADRSAPRPRRPLQEPAGEPRIERRPRPPEREREPVRSSPPGRRAPALSGVEELDVPEFIPRR